jgi:predicted nucleotidyltransferase
MDALPRELPKLQTRFHVQYLGLFGSYVQGTPRRDSDLDVLVEFAEEPSLFEFIEWKTTCGHQGGSGVKDTLKPLIGRHILSEVVGL